MKSKTYITLIVFCLFSNQLFAQLAEFKKTTDKRYLGKLNGFYFSSPGNLMESFEFGFEWWTLMGEPLEIYHFKWKAKDSYTIGGKICRRADLIKYPDLLRRYDNIKPSHVDLKITGTLSGHSVKVNRGDNLNTPGNYIEGMALGKEGSKSYQLNQEFLYFVEDHKLYYSRAGEDGNDIVPGSPHWNNFLRYDVFRFASSRAKADQNDEALKTNNITIFRNSTILRIAVSIDKIEWPEHELRAIIKQYEGYEAGESVPSPIEYTDSIIAKNKNVPTYTKDDEWAQPLPDFKLTSFYDNQTGKYGYKNEYGQVAIAAIYSDASEFEDRMAIVSIDKRYGVINKSGLFIIEPKFLHVKQIYKNVVVVKDLDEYYRLCDLQGAYISSKKFGEISRFENDRASAYTYTGSFEDNVFWSAIKGSRYGVVTTVYDIDRGEINLKGEWIGGTTRDRTSHKPL